MIIFHCVANARVAIKVLYKMVGASNQNNRLILVNRKPSHRNILSVRNE